MTDAIVTDFSFPKLVAVDLDGTLLNAEKEISPENADAIFRLRDAGAQVFIATGRSHENALRFHRQLDLNGFLVSTNGAMVKHAETGETLLRLGLDANLAHELLTIGKEHQITQIWEDLETGDLVTAKSDRFSDILVHRSKTHVPEAGDLAVRYADQAPLKLLWIAEPETVLYFRDRLRAAYGGRLYITRTDDEYLEFLNPRANKSNAVAAVARRLGISLAETAAIGDGDNDSEMLRDVGLGIALAHGSPDARAAAKHIAPPGPPETALARAIDELLRK